MLDRTRTSLLLTLFFSLLHKRRIYFGDSTNLLIESLQMLFGYSKLFLQVKKNLYSK